MQNCDVNLEDSLWGTFADSKGMQQFIQKSLPRPPNEHLLLVLLWSVWLGYGKKRSKTEPQERESRHLLLAPQVADEMFLDPNVTLSDAALLLKEHLRRDSKMPYFAVPPVPLGTKSQAAVAHIHVHTRTHMHLDQAGNYTQETITDGDLCSFNSRTRL